MVSSRGDLGAASNVGCPYYHPVACGTPAMHNFLELWRKKVECWLCDNTDFVVASNGIIQSLMGSDIGITKDRLITGPWLETCLPGYLVAMFASTRSPQIQTMRFYQFALDIIRVCEYDDAMFYQLYSITTTQIAYVFFVIAYPYWASQQEGQWQWQLDEKASMRNWTSSLWNAPLVIDIGMGLGADTRYYLWQGFRVVGVEANPDAIKAAVSDEWTGPYLRSGQLSVLNVAVAKPGSAEKSISFYSVPHRPEMSNAQEWVTDDGGQETKVRTLECADLISVFGQAVYMKIDIESNSVDCLESLYHKFTSSRHLGWRPPAWISLEMEATDLALKFFILLESMGYTEYKICRQYIYSPSPCEQRGYSSEVPGCGSGPFGNAAVDYKHGLEWRSLSELQNDTDWAHEFVTGFDWFDLHVRLS